MLCETKARNKTMFTFGLRGIEGGGVTRLNSREFQVVCNCNCPFIVSPHVCLPRLGVDMNDMNDNKMNAA